VNKAYEVLIKWRGLQELENSWEPNSNIAEDVAVLLKAFATKTTLRWSKR
jgi:hypothetical protein